jgi:indole-3-glycerol phosphate synthase
VSRFSQAISEGDGISIVPYLRGNVAELAALAEQAGAEAVAVETAADGEPARQRSALPVLIRRGRPEDVSASGADACILVVDELRREAASLEEAYARARELGLDCAVEVRDEGELATALERLDPEIIVISESAADADEEEDLERTLDLLPDVPAGKLVISQSRIVAREQAVALERAGVDAVLVSDVGQDFAATLAELVRGSGAGA